VTAAEAVREAVLSGLGLTISSECLFAPELKSGRVRAVLEDWTLRAIDLWAVFPTGRRPSAMAKAIVSFVESHLPGNEGVAAMAVDAASHSFEVSGI